MTKEEEIFELLFDKDEVTWQSIIYEAVRSEQMDPWDIDITLLTRRYIEMLRKLKEMNFRISGKILLAAAVLLKIKSTRLVGKDMDNLDRMISQAGDGNEDIGYDDYIEPARFKKEDIPRLIPRTPQPRKRKVSIYDLIEALQSALEVKERRIVRITPNVRVTLPEKLNEIGVMIKEVYSKIMRFFNSGNKGLTFNKLTNSKSRKDKIEIFIPLLYLSNMRKIDLNQEEHFGEIEIVMK